MLTTNETQWQQERESAAQRFFGCTATEFAKRLNKGDYDPVKDHNLMYVLSFFPELD